MKIAILSDFHLGYERFREDAYTQAKEALEKASELADVLIIPGDIFDGRAPKPDVIAESINLFRDLSKKKWRASVKSFSGEGWHYTTIPIIAIPGTHERRAADVADPVDILGLAGLVVDAKNATAVIELDGETVAVRGMGGIADDRFRDAVIDENPTPVAGAFNIFMFHESVYELLPFNAAFIKQEELPKGFDLYVSGHLHGRTEEKVHGKKFLIPGSTVLTQLREGEQEQKGLYIFDTKTGNHEFVKIKSRRFVLCKVQSSGLQPDKLVEKIRGAIDAAVGSSGDKPIVRVMLEGKVAKGGNAEIEINGIPRSYDGRALVEISKAGLTTESLKEMSSPGSIDFEKMSVKDYGISVFLEKVKQQGVDIGKISPVELLDILGADQAKDKSIKKALDELIW